VRGATQVVNSYEHDEKGYGAQGEIASARVGQNEKRLRKIERARDLVPPPKRYGPETADLSLIVFGTTKQPALEAMGWLADEGVDMNMLQIITLWPFPAEDVSEFLDAATRTLIVEGNATGQLEGLIRQECLRGADDRLHRYDGRPFSPEQIYAHVKRMLGIRVDALPSGASLEEVGLDA